MIKKQRGLTAISWMIIIALVAIQGVMALRIIPVYMDFNAVKSVMKSVAEDSESRGKTPGFLRGAIFRRLQINNIYSLDDQSLSFQQLSDGMQVTVNYEARGPIYGNLEFIATFEHEIIIPKN
ncbi:MAG TPA: DUF4845 domain-containing protein [Gammaproteobacteria bacterium]